MSTISPSDDNLSDKQQGGSVSQLANQVYTLATGVLRDAKRSELTSGLTSERLSILSLLVNFGSKTVNEIAEVEQVSAPAITRIVKGLEKDGYVIKAKSKTDQRVVFVSATRKTKMLLQQIKQESMVSLKNKLNTFSDSELQALTNFLSRLC